jgi:ABC-type lipoprotein release transport system permease subunit
MASIFFAVFLATVQRSFQLGTYDRMISTVVRSTTGFARIQTAGYQEDPTLDNALLLSDSLREITGPANSDFDIYARIESYALVASDVATKGVQIIGLDPEKEKDLQDFSSKLTEGTGPQPGEVLLGTELARFLNVQPGDTLVALGQGRYGSTAAGKYTVAGIAKFANKQLNTGLMYMTFTDAQTLFSMPEMCTSLVIDPQDNTNINNITTTLKNQLNVSAYEVMSWQELMPELVQAIQADNVSGVIMTAILYMVVIFGIFGTILMMTGERQYEFGVSLAIGLHRYQLAGTVFLEILLLAFLGTLAGIAAAYPLCVYYADFPIALTGDAATAIEEYGWEPVMAASKRLSIPLANGGLILAISALLSLYPAGVIAFIKPVEAMRKG